jgi:hypothetical protein
MQAGEMIDVDITIIDIRPYLGVKAGVKKNRLVLR